MSRKSEIGSFVGRRIEKLQDMAERKETGRSGNAMLASLRRGVGKAPGELPELFGVVLPELSEEFTSSDGIATKEEWASYTALTLYALHRQGGDGEKDLAHTKEKVSVGRALKMLSDRQQEGKQDLNAEKRALQKMKMLITAKDMGELSYHLRGVVQLLKREEIPLNYIALAEDLYEFQCVDGKNRVSLRWGRDFYRENNKKQDEEVSE